MSLALIHLLYFCLDFVNAVNLFQMYWLIIPQERSFVLLVDCWLLPISKLLVFEFIEIEFFCPGQVPVLNIFSPYIRNSAVTLLVQNLNLQKFIVFKDHFIVLFQESIIG